jgi:hypothetical protein
VFDHVTLVVSRSHLGPAKKLVPRWWGILVPTASRKTHGVEFRRERLSAPNPQPDIAAAVQLLWRDEALELLRRHALARGLVGRARNALWNALVERLPRETLHSDIRRILKSREHWRTSPTVD